MHLRSYSHTLALPVRVLNLRRRKQSDLLGFLWIPRSNGIMPGCTYARPRYMAMGILAVIRQTLGSAGSFKLPVALSSRLIAECGTV